LLRSGPGDIGHRLRGLQIIRKPKQSQAKGLVSIGIDADALT
jgi:hypothetical protein